MNKYIRNRKTLYLLTMKKETAKRTIHGVQAITEALKAVASGKMPKNRLIFYLHHKLTGNRNEAIKIATL
jgi:hypothetical protein